MKFGWRTALRVAWREARSSSMKFVFVVLAVAAGVGALTGVRGFSTSFERMLLGQARTMMAADMSVRIFGDPTARQVEEMDALGKRGVRRTEIIETLSMVSGGDSADTLLVSVKSIDPAVYPFYGEVKLDPPARLRALLDDKTVAVSDDLPIRMNAKTGDRVRIGSADYRIGAVLVMEPDRMSGSMNVGPRILMSRAGLERAGLMQVGSRAAHRFLFRLPGDNLVQPVREQLKKTFPEGLIVDFREINPNIKRALERSSTFLSLVSLIALIVGALGVAMAMHTHLREKMDTIAIMKCLGARNGQVVRIYVTQTLLLGLAGGVLGIVFGLGVQKIFPLLIARYFEAPQGVGLDPVSALQGLAVGVLTTLLFTLPPLLGVRTVKPGVIFRRDMAEARPNWRVAARRWRGSAGVTLVILAGVAGIAAWLSESARVGLWFAGGLVAGIAALSVVAWGLLWGLRLFVRMTPWRLPATVRHGIANLYRPGNYAQPVLVALGIGVMFTLSVYLIQHSLLQQIARSVPPGVPNVFLVNITPAEAPGVQALLKKQAGVLSGVEMVPLVAARLVSVDGTNLESVALQGFQRRYLRTRSISWADAPPAAVKVEEGQWWKADAKEPLASISSESAKVIGAKVGSVLEWDVAGMRVKARVAALHKNEQVWTAANQEFILDRAALKKAPMIYYGGIRAAAASVPRIQRAVHDGFPTVTVINAADVLSIIQEVIDQVAIVVRFISAFAILAGVVILASSVAGTRFRRVREVVILKTLGAKRNRLAGIFSVEFLILGLAAGVMGSLLASAFSGLLLKRVLDVEFQFDWLPNVVAILATAAIANGAGWLASFRILGQKPLAVLREE